MSAAMWLFIIDVVGANLSLCHEAMPISVMGNYRKDGNKGFDTIINRLQAQGYVLISDFRYMIDKNGKEYGWGVAEYSTPEQFLGKSFKDRVYMRTPEESFEALLDHFRKILPGMDENRIKRFLIK